MGQNELAVMDELDSIVQAFNTNDEAALMKASGQSSQPKQTGLPRLNINYDTETDDGTSLTRGHWRITIDGRCMLLVLSSDLSYACTSIVAGMRRTIRLLPSLYRR